MVFYFKLLSNPEVTCYMGRDKYENEELIRWGWPEDVWAHVDALSSAHVYVRFPIGSVKAGSNMAELMTPAMIEEVGQLTKANSIEGCKKNNVKIVFTPWANLRKTNDMEVGQVSFHDEKMRWYHTIEKKDNAILKHHDKDKVDHEHVDFRTEREQRDAEARRMERLAEKEAAEEAKRIAKEQAEAKDQKHYTSLMTADKMKVNNNRNDDDEDLEDDFM